MYVVWVNGAAAVLVGLVLIAFVPSWQRHQLGDLAGNVLLALEVAWILVGWAALSQVRAKRNLRAASLGLAILGSLFFYISWAVHPGVVLARADQRVSSLEWAMEDYRMSLKEGLEDSKAAEKTERLRGLLYVARRLQSVAEAEYAAYRGSKLGADSWAFLFLGISAIAAAIALFKVAPNEPAASAP